ncbi:MAG TPA: dihydroorotate dehydrogenase electron transfer subunit [Planctomycetota bacterium]|nr:dihydroorotate dehydrogenase electron transfer subunit [Planctomycetota bacterium]
MHAIWNGEATVVRQTRYSPQCWKMTLALPTAEPIEAGQFCHVLCDPGTDPLLRRPFSYWDSRPAGAGQEIDLLYTVVGRGTGLLAAKGPGSRVGYLGPLGIGFTPKPARTWVFVAGGVGIVPFYLFARQAARRGPAPRMILLFGGRTDSMLYGIDDFPAIGVEPVAATEDGSRGTRGLVTALLEAQLSTLDRSSLQIYTCGPDRMMDAVIRIARRESLPCEVSMERHMGCGLGAFGACVTRVVSDDGSDWRHSRICYEGPTYDAARLVLE